MRYVKRTLIISAIIILVLMGRDIIPTIINIWGVDIPVVYIVVGILGCTIGWSMQRGC
jgi:small neutral amino acid transporter SnatA (MarC family)